MNIRLSYPTMPDVFVKAIRDPRLRLAEGAFRHTPALIGNHTGTMMFFPSSPKWGAAARR